MAKFARSRKAIARVRTRAGNAATRVRTVYRNVTAPPAGSSRRRRVAAAAVRGAGFMAVAQAKIVPAAAGGYVVAKLERNQRVSEKPMIKDHRNRLLAELAILAVARTKTSGLMTAAIDGGAGAIGALYEAYTGGGISEGVIATPPKA